jgi:hypothetical protein
LILTIASPAVKPISAAMESGSTLVMRAGWIVDMGISEQGTGNREQGTGNSWTYLMTLG